ncbi:MAG TPA: HAD domain-containing protein [Mucilaginibacter sp.]|nr:HAD domain-containing protein [Mucilaginibacter sp.]
MRILLDIDGVMVPANSWRQPEMHSDGFPVFSPRAVDALKRILAETNASILLTTSHKSKYTPAQWKNLLSARGINAKKIDKLPDNLLQDNRREEILGWYSKHPRSKRRTVIIDDDKQLGALPPELKERLVLTSPSVGLTAEHAEKAISILRAAV